MGWFDEQIRERKKQDNERFADAMDEISAIITKRKSGFSGADSAAATAKDFHSR